MTATRRRIGAWLVAGLLTLLASRVEAQRAAEPATADTSEHRPWAAGVSRAEQAAALELYVSGNQEFAEARFAQALAKYREAIRHWDHPAIRFNMAVCLINLDQPIEAMDDLQRSLVFGEAAIGAVAYGEAMTYRKLLDGQLARLKIGSREAGTQITLDGKHRFTTPGVFEEIVLPGEHQVVATRPGFVTVTRTLVLVAGKAMSYDVPPLEAKVTATLIRRWPAWGPWLVLAGGAALVGGGALSYAAATTNFAAYDRGIAADCPHGCDAITLLAFPGIARSRARGDHDQSIAFAMFAAGGTAIIAGVVGLVVNSPRVQMDASRPLPTVAVRPGGVVVGVGGGF